MVADPPTVVSLGMHTLRWEYSKDGSSSDDDDCGWVDYLQWDGDAEPPPDAEWETLRYVYACPIRLSLRAGSEPAERDPGRRPSSSNNQSSIILHHFPRLYGPSVDEPICMIEEAGTYSGTYYYHFDALGSVVALSNAAGNTVQAYDYSVWGQVGAWDPDHPNPYLFTGRRFDKETGLYYYRARYYNPEIGRFLQSDPVGYVAGMNLFEYCGNNPLNRVDPYGLDSNDVNDSNDRKGVSDVNWLLVDWPRTLNCSENIDRQQIECRRRALKRVERLNFAVNYTGVGGTVVMGVLCGAGTRALVMAAPPAGAVLGTICVAATIKAGVTAIQARAAISEAKSCALAYCDNMASWCKGELEDMPIWNCGLGGRTWASEGRPFAKAIMRK